MTPFEIAILCAVISAVIVFLFFFNDTTGYGIR